MSRLRARFGRRGPRTMTVHRLAPQADCAVSKASARSFLLALRDRRQPVHQYRLSQRFGASPFPSANILRPSPMVIPFLPTLSLP